MGEPPDEEHLLPLGFFGAVALLERLDPSAARIGGADLALEGIRFKHDESLSFSAQDLSAARRLPRPGGKPLYELTTTFLGLTGGASPTPSYLTEEVLLDESHAQRDFLDIFHHRLISLLYRELSRLKPWAEQTADLSDPWSARLFALGGFAEAPGRASALSAPDLLRLLPLLTGRVRGSASLSVAIEDSMRDISPEAQVTLHEFAGGWSDLPRREQTQLGTRSSTLGHDLLIGARVLDPAGAFEIHLTHLDQRGFQHLAEPGGPLARVHQLVALWSPDPLEYRVIVTLSPEQVTPMRIGQVEGSCLGTDTWLGGCAQPTAVTVYPSAGAPEASRADLD